jgi:hypothetical protein
VTYCAMLSPKHALLALKATVSPNPLRPSDSPSVASVTYCAMLSPKHALLALKATVSPNPLRPSDPPL